MLQAAFIRLQTCPWCRREIFLRTKSIRRFWDPSYHSRSSSLEPKLDGGVLWTRRRPPERHCHSQKAATRQETFLGVQTITTHAIGLLTHATKSRFAQASFGGDAVDFEGAPIRVCVTWVNTLGAPPPTVHRWQFPHPDEVRDGTAASIVTKAHPEPRACQRTAPKYAAVPAICQPTGQMSTEAHVGRGANQMTGRVGNQNT